MLRLSEQNNDENDEHHRCLQVIEEEEEELVLSKVGCFVWLAVVTLLISVLSDFIMDAISGKSEKSEQRMNCVTQTVCCARC
jgi:hypothetical protein